MRFIYCIGLSRTSQRDLVVFKRRETGIGGKKKEEEKEELHRTLHRAEILRCFRNCNELIRIKIKRNFYIYISSIPMCI